MIRAGAWFTLPAVSQNCSQCMLVRAALCPFVSPVHNCLAGFLGTASEKGLISVFGLLDFSATFGTVDHRNLLQRLEHLFGIRETVLDSNPLFLADLNFYMLIRCAPCAPNAQKEVMVFHQVLCSEQHYSPIYVYLFTRLCYLAPT